jgi:hypothetical protein
MKFIFISLVVINVAMFGLGQGWFGTPRAEAGRNPAMLQQQLNAAQLTVTPAVSQGRP